MFSSLNVATGLPLHQMEYRRRIGCLSAVRRAMMEPRRLTNKVTDARMGGTAPGKWLGMEEFPVALSNGSIRKPANWPAQ